MINQNELRIGNLVLIESFLNASIGVVTSISSNRILVKCDNENYSSKVNTFSGIILTEDWLLKAGFKINMENFNWNAAIGKK